MIKQTLELALPPELIEELQRIAETLGLRDANEAAVVGIADWVARQKAAIEASDPHAKYFVNEALDHLIERQR